MSDTTRLLPTTTDDDRRQPTPMERIATLLVVCDHDLDLTVDDAGRDIWDAEMDTGVWRIKTINRAEPARLRLWTLRFMPNDKILVQGVAHSEDADFIRNADAVTEAVQIWHTNARELRGLDMVRHAAKQAFTH